MSVSSRQRKPTERLDHLTFRGNLRETRYGWLRLTPAYSVHLVGEILDAHHRGGVVLDPFCGTGTTALVCAERGIACDTTDINPFLLWLARAKTRVYSARHAKAFREKAARVARAMRAGEPGWTPPLHQIEKWWSAATLGALARTMGEIRRIEKPAEVLDLLAIAFCRVMIGSANVSFGHQSMSFKAADAKSPAIAARALQRDWEDAVESIASACTSEIRREPSPIACDARDLRASLEPKRYALVVTSPPYPNRMSYIRELRPYMYWLGFLSDGRAAGELDWKAIGGTWGCATSNVAKWKAPERRVPYDGFRTIVDRIAKRSAVLGPYVAKYFDDMIDHASSLFDVVAPGGTVHYIVGNSKFYDVMLPVEDIFASLFESAGFVDANVRTIRKRTSKKELFEFVVSAKRPSA